MIVPLQKACSPKTLKGVNRNIDKNIYVNHLNREKIISKKTNSKTPAALVFEKTVGVFSGIGKGASM
tara:strand:+ start:409 stop:609 length:201 start_codon:yes stop_codon:yes gene_type:complete